MLIQRNTRLLYSVLTFGIFLAMGFAGGNSIGLADVAPQGKLSTVTSGQVSTASGASNPDQASNNQQTILVIGLDRLEQASPRLLSVWLIIYIPSTPNLTLLPLYPASIESGPAQDDFLETAFRLTPDYRPDPSFFTAVQARDLKWDHYILLDEIALAELIDITGGIERWGEGVALTGIQSIAEVTHPWEDPQLALYDQTSLIGALCGAEISTSQVNPVYLFELLSHHFRTDFEPQEALQEWQKLGRTTGHVTCKFPTIEQELAGKPSEPSVSPAP